MLPWGDDGQFTEIKLLEGVFQDAEIQDWALQLHSKNELDPCTVSNHDHNQKKHGLQFTQTESFLGGAPYQINLDDDWNDVAEVAQIVNVRDISKHLKSHFSTVDSHLR